MPKYKQNEVWDLFESSLSSAKRKLAQVEVAERRLPTFKALRGWVFEQTIQYCLRNELASDKRKPEWQEQVGLGGRAIVDLLIGNVAIEIKLSGLYDKLAIERYGRYAKLARSKGWSYLYITGEEAYSAYQEGIVRAVGKENAFFLDEPGEWNWFVRRIKTLLSND